MFDRRLQRVGRRSAVAVLVGLAGISAVIGGVVYATIPGTPSTQIVACFATSGPTTGLLRVIDYDAGQRCRSTERMTQWQAKGVAYRGKWSSTRLYQKDDVVTYNGTAYIAFSPSLGAAPPNTKWSTFAAKGATGPQGPRGVQGVQGPQGVPGPGPMIVGTNNPETSNVGTNGEYLQLPNASIGLASKAFERTAVVTFWSSAACFGSGTKYAKLYVDGVEKASAPLAPVPNPGGTTEMASSITAVVTIAAGATFSAEVRVNTAPTTSCTWNVGHWSLSAVTTSSS